MSDGTDGQIDGISNFVFDENNIERSPWKICDYTIPRSEVVFFCQIITVLIVFVFCGVKLSLPNTSCEEASIYIAFLSGAVGFLIPNPKL